MKCSFIFLGIAVSVWIRTAFAQEGVIVVQADDNLKRIAAKHLSNQERWVEIWAWNLPVIGKDPESVIPKGTKISLPLLEDNCWEARLFKNQQCDCGWLVEFVCTDSTHHFIVSVGYNERGMKFALNAFDIRQAITRFLEWLPDPDSDFDMVIRNASGYALRYQDPHNVLRVNYRHRPLPTGLPPYILIASF